MWGAEGPEILVVNKTTMNLYFDCSFQPFDKSKWRRPPYGVATAKYPDGYTDPNSWETLPGSWAQRRSSFASALSSRKQSDDARFGPRCTGNNSAVMDFPPGATQGSFICVTDEQYAAIEKKWPA